MTAIIVWIALAAALATGFVMTGFLVIASAKRVLAAGVKLPLALKATCLFWGVVGVVADAAYQMTVGTVRFRELPRELLYSGRIQRLVREGSGWRLEKAKRWAAILNSADPGHIGER
jgi:hypothetical protein